MIKEIRNKEFANGKVYLLETHDGYPIETTDTFLPYYTKDAKTDHQNALKNYDVGDRTERWMVGVSTMSGCPVRCKFCATGKLRKTKLLTAKEIVDQVEFVLDQNFCMIPSDAQEFKINYTRMGEPFLNIKNVKQAIETLDIRYGANNIHHYISTIGIEGSDFSWIKDNITLQFSIHSFDEDYRNWLIPYKKKMKLEEIGLVETESDLKTTLNMTIVRPEDFDIKELNRIFDKDKFFIKISPINPNDIAEKNDINSGAIEQINLK